MAFAGRSGVRALGPARPRVTLRARHAPAEPTQRRSTSTSSVLPTQVGEPKATANQLCVRCLGEDIRAPAHA
eukprot:1256343-Alexandrium_andersonii.AAC.1